MSLSKIIDMDVVSYACAIGSVVICTIDLNLLPLFCGNLASDFDQVGSIRMGRANRILSAGASGVCETGAGKPWADQDRVCR